MDRKIRWCRHHQKPEPMVDTCALGIDLPPIGERGFGGFYKLPCHDAVDAGIKKATCDKCSLFTDAEVAEQEAEAERDLDQFILRMTTLNPLIESIKAMRLGLAGRRPCPVCGQGSLSWSVAPTNKHVAMRCSTDDCVGARTDRLLDLDAIHERLRKRETPPVPTRLPVAVSEDELLAGYSRDIAKCQGQIGNDLCPKREQCVRFNLPGLSRHQSWLVPTRMGDECSSFWEMP